MPCIVFLETRILRELVRPLRRGPAFPENQLPVARRPKQRGAARDEYDANGHGSTGLHGRPDESRWHASVRRPPTLDGLTDLAGANSSQDAQVYALHSYSRWRPALSCAQYPGPAA